MSLTKAQASDTGILPSVQCTSFTRKQPQCSTPMRSSASVRASRPPGWSSSSAPSVNFTPIQMKLAHRDKMNEYVRYESKAVFACPPGLAEGQDWGTTLFG